MDDVLTFISMVPGVPAERPEDLDYEAEPVGEWEEGEEAPGAFFVDTWSDAGADTVERLRSVDSPEWDLLSERTVAEAMSRAIVSASPSDELATAAHRMEGANIHRLLVMDRGRLVGIVTTSDVTRAVAHPRV
jgi:CBS domain-containing protein